MIVPAKNEIDSHRRESAEDFLGALQSVTLRQLTLHGIVMHYDYSRRFARRILKCSFRSLDLLVSNVADDRDVAKIPGQCPKRDSVRSIHSDECCAGNLKHRLEIV